MDTISRLSDRLTSRLGPNWHREAALIVAWALTFSQTPYGQRVLGQIRHLLSSSFSPKNAVPPTARTTLFKASDTQNDHKSHLLLCATGSVATIKLPLIINALTRHHRQLEIKILLTDSAATFLQSQSPEQPSLSTLLSALPPSSPFHLTPEARACITGIYRDADEWRKPWQRGDPILHIELRRWADLMVIAPLSADSLAKICLGLANDLVSSVARAWDAEGLVDTERPGVRWPYEVRNGHEVSPAGSSTERRKGIVVAPAMNTAMWEHPITQEYIQKLEGEWGVENGGWVEVLRPVEKGLACGDTGSGAMKDWRDIVKVIEERLRLGHDGGVGI